MLKIVLAIINTLVLSGLAFGILFGFGFIGFEGFGTYRSFGEMASILGILLLVPILVFGIIFGWVILFKPLKSLSKSNKLIIAVAAIVIGGVSIMIAGQVGIFIYL